MGVSMDTALTLPQQFIITSLKDIISTKHNEAINVMINIGLLTKETPQFSINNEISGERKENAFRIWNRNSVQIFHADIEPNKISVAIFIRGTWEKSLEEYALNGDKETKKLPRTRPKLKLRDSEP
jgi:hypothetical protein